MTEQIEDKKLPWPSRLANYSIFCVIFGSIFFAIGVSIELVGITSELSWVEFIAGIGLFIALFAFVSAFILSIISLLGMLLYRFKIPNFGKAFGVFISIMLLLALGFSIVYPAAKHAYIAAQEINCKHNIRLLMTNYHLYTEKYNKRLDKAQWCDYLQLYTVNDDNILMCPKDKVGPCSYAMNEGIPADANELPGDLVVLFESAPGWNRVGGADDVVTGRHSKPGANIAFADGHVEFVEAADIPNLRWTMDNRSVERQ